MKSFTSVSQLAWFGSLVFLVVLLGFWFAARFVWGQELIVGLGVRSLVYLGAGLLASVFSYFVVRVSSRKQRPGHSAMETIARFGLVPALAGLAILAIGGWSFMQMENLMTLQSVVLLAGFMLVYCFFMCYRLADTAGDSVLVEKSAA